MESITKLRLATAACLVLAVAACDRRDSDPAASSTDTAADSNATARSGTGDSGIGVMETTDLPPPVDGSGAAVEEPMAAPAISPPPTTPPPVREEQGTPENAVTPEPGR